MRCYCNHCDTLFDSEQNRVINSFSYPEGDVVCPRCGAGVWTKNPMLTHEANKPMTDEKIRDFISRFGWRRIKKCIPQCLLDENLRPADIKKSHEEGAKKGGDAE